MEASFALAQDVNGWGQTKSTGDTLGKQVFEMNCAKLNNEILGGDNPVLDPIEDEHAIELKREVGATKSLRMAKVPDFLEMWLGSQNLCATQRVSRAQNRQGTAVGYNFDTERIINASWSNLQIDGEAAFKLSERSHLQSRTLGEEKVGLCMPASWYSHQQITHLHNNQPLN